MRVALITLLVLAACSDTPTSGADASAPGADAAAPDATPRDDAGLTDGGATPLMCNPTFADPQACGGDIVGSWRYIDVCGAPKEINNFIGSCPAARLVRNQHTITGTAGFAADMTYGWSLSDDFDVALEVPIACTDSSGGCAGFGLLVSIGLRQTVTCTERDAAFCDCVTMGNSSDKQQGTYGVITATITSTRSDGKKRDYYFCVDGDRAMYRRSDDGIVVLIERR